MKLLYVAWDYRQYLFGSWNGYKISTVNENATLVWPNKSNEVKQTKYKLRFTTYSQIQA